MTIDDDVLAVSGRLAAARKVSTGQALSDLARRVQKVLLTEPQVTLGLLLEGITAENLHGEIDSGPPVGGEVW